MIPQQLFCFQIMKSSAKKTMFCFCWFLKDGRQQQRGRFMHWENIVPKKKCNITRTDHCDAASELFSWSEQLRGFFELPWPFHRRFLWKITEKRMNSSSSIKRRRIITKMLCQNWLFKAETQPENNHFACHQAPGRCTTLSKLAENYRVTRTLHFEIQFWS